MSNRRPKVSVIVPIYNVEQYLETCVESIMAQTLQDIEIILVDDKTPDSSGEIADALAKRDSRIRVIHREENGGLGPARNSGLDVATGEYVAFVDSDDWVDEDLCEATYSCAKKVEADICYFGMRRVADGVMTAERPHPRAGQVIHGTEAVREFRKAFYGAAAERVVDEGTPVSACSSLIRLDLIREEQAVFEAIRSEDIFFNILVTRGATTVAFAKGVYYNYRKDGQASITGTFKPSTVDSYIALFNRLIEVASSETPAAYRAECEQRAKRRVIDYTRSLGTIMYCAALAPSEIKLNMQQVRSEHALVWALKGYPWWKLPLQQAAFFVAFDLRLYRLIHVLLWIRCRRGL